MSQPLSVRGRQAYLQRLLDIEAWLDRCEDILAREDQLKRRLAEIQREAQLKAEPILFELGIIEQRRPPKPLVTSDAIVTYCGPQHYDPLTLKRLKEQIGVQE